MITISCLKKKQITQALTLLPVAIGPPMTAETRNILCHEPLVALEIYYC